MIIEVVWLFCFEDCSSSTFHWKLNVFKQFIIHKVKNRGLNSYISGNIIYHRAGTCRELWGEVG